MECKTCVHADFERTPTGRIKRNYVGRCMKSDEIVSLARECAAPCVQVAVYGVGIWPNTDATNCAHWQPAAHQPAKEPHSGQKD